MDNEQVSSNGKAILTLKGPLGIALAIFTMISGNTLPALAAAQILVPVWIPIVFANITSILLIVGQMSGGLRTKRPKKAAAPLILGTVPVPVPPETK